MTAMNTLWANVPPRLLQLVFNAKDL
jgi:hypothetical protein